MALFKDSLVQLATAGAGLVINCTDWGVDPLVEIVRAGKGTGSKIVLTNTQNLWLPSLLKIVAAGDGNVIIDTREGVAVSE